MNDENRPSGAASEAMTGRPFAYSQFTGDIDLVEISGDSENPRAEVYLAGWAAGWESQQAEIDRLKWEREFIYFLLHNPGKTGAHFYKSKTDQLWNEAVQ